MKQNLKILKHKTIIWRMVIICAIIMVAWGLGQLFAPTIMKAVFL